MTNATAVPQKKAVADYLKAKADPAVFISDFCYIKDENTGTVGPFTLWDFQRDLLHEWQQYRLNVNLKARQLGISWLMTAFALWLVNFFDNITILCISKSQEKAYDLIKKIKFMYDRLPPHLKKEMNERNAGSLGFVGDEGGDGSRIIALPSTPGSAVGYTATLVLLDEWGEQDYAEELFSAYKPTIDMGGRLIGIGTGNAVGSFYHEICMQAMAGENGFHFRFLGWDLRPGRDQDWYDRTKKGYPNQQEWFRMYPANVVEAFIAAGGCPFSMEDIQWYLDNYVRPPQSVEWVESSYMGDKLKTAAAAGDLWVWESAHATQPYEVTFDPATGQEGSDYHAIHVIKLGANEQVAEYRSRKDTDLVCDLAWELARYYNSAEIVWERTGVGHAATNNLSRTGYTNLYQHEEVEVDRAVRQGKIKPSKHKVLKLGWPASRSSNFARDTDLIAAIREHSVIIHSQRFFDEAQGFVRQADGSYAATGRAHDDLITSFGMGLHVAIRRLGKVVPTGQPTRSSKKRAFRRERWR